MSADKLAIVLIAYGSCVASGLTSLRNFEARVRRRYPGLPVRWAYTSAHIRTRLAVQVRHKSDSVVKAIRRLVLERFGAIVAQPLQIVSATENEGVEDMTREMSAELGVPVSVGTPLLATDEDVELCVQAMLASLPPERASGDNVIYVGHGTSHMAQRQYARVAGLVHARDRTVHMATLSGDMTMETVLPHLTSRRLWLEPFLSTVGKHTVSDIAGEQPHSLKSRLEALGYACEVRKTGVLEHRAFADIWLAHLDRAAARFGLEPVPDGP